MGAYVCYEGVNRVLKLLVFVKCCEKNDPRLFLELPFGKCDNIAIKVQVLF